MDTKLDDRKISQDAQADLRRRGIFSYGQEYRKGRLLPICTCIVKRY